MNISFAADLPPGGEWSEVESNIRNELSHFEDRFVDFPSALVVRLETDKYPWRATGFAAGPDGIPLIEINYDLFAPHTADYRYVGSSAPIEVPEDPADA
ncbi:MAG: hypothetical protein Q8L39_01750 [Burkholderiales bacterium]|nr:hypothetical protein [Burkholderiales bacterium]